MSRQGLRKRRSSTATTTTDTVVETVKKAERKAESALLLLLEDLPPWRHDNEYILSGYRPDSNSYVGSLASTLWLHNESVNIWTHLFGALVFPGIGLWLYREVVAPRWSSWWYRGGAGPATGADVLVFGCFFAGAALCLGMSATYHALMNHSEGVAKWGNKLDYSGIVALIVGSYVPALYYSMFCEGTWMVVYMYGIFLLGFGCGVVSWVERFRTPRWRPYRAAVFVGLGVSGVVPICHGLVKYGYPALDERMGLSWILLEGFFYIFGAFLYAVRWPECKGPGTYDIWGNSHQIFHVLILLAAASHLKGIVKAFDYHHSVMGQC